MAVKGLSNLCPPAKLYLGISVIALVIMAIQNLGSLNTYCLGNYSCQVSSTLLIFVVKIVYVLFWTWILNLICNAGLPMLSWFLVLIPFVIMFILVGALMLGY